MSDLLEITKKLQIQEKERVAFVEKILAKTESQIETEANLKILYFDICQELQKMEKIKKRIDDVSNRRVTLLLAIFLIALIIQTGVYYHMIFNVEHLGWDLVEPTTFLVSSSLFLLGVFSYVKLHRNALSGERIFQDFRKSFLLRRYVRDNFNYEKYDTLLKRRKLVSQEIEMFKH